VRRIDYFLGKLGVIGFVLAAVTIVPAALAYVLGVLFSLDFSVLRDTWRFLAASIGYGLVVVVSAGTMMLALSSLSRNSRYVGLLWIGLWIISNVVGAILGGMHEASVHRDAWHAEMQRGAKAGGNQRQDWQRIQDKINEAKAEAAQSNWRPLFSYTENLNRIRVYLFGANDSFEKLGNIGGGPGQGRAFAAMMLPQYPWYWSAGVLAGLLGLSVWILTTRVKSLDRLK
jgi:ABC-2 type transport system permease protein